jgi:hypothetical protein
MNAKHRPLILHQVLVCLNLFFLKRLLSSRLRTTAYESEDLSYATLLFPDGIMENFKALRPNPNLNYTSRCVGPSSFDRIRLCVHIKKIEQPHLRVFGQ